VLTVGLAVAWLVLALRRRRVLDARARIATAGLAALVVVALAFSARSPVVVFGHAWSWTPSRVLWEIVPAIRVPSRWIAMLMTALVPLAALGLQASYAALARRASARAGLAAVSLVAAACIASVLELAVHRSDPIFRTVPVPPQYQALKRVSPGILAEYPLEHSDIELLWQREHGRPLLGGAPDGTYAADVSRSLADPRTPGTAAALARLGVTAVIMPVESHAKLGDGFELLERFGNGSSLWRVNAAPAPAVASLPDPDFLKPRRSSDGFFGQPLTGKTGDVDFWAPQQSVVRLHFDARSTSRKQWTLQIAGADSETTVPISGRTPVSVAVELPAGYSRLHLRVDPDPDSGEFPLELSAPVATPSADPPRVRAWPISGADLGAPER
jgi:hypothetical protein